MTVQEMLNSLFAYGFSQKAVADRTGTTQPTIHRASKGPGFGTRQERQSRPFFLKQLRKPPPNPALSRRTRK